MLAARRDAQMLGGVGCHTRKRLAHAASINELGRLGPAVDLDPIWIAGVGVVDRRDHVVQPFAVVAHPLHAPRRLHFSGTCLRRRRPQEAAAPAFPTARMIGYLVRRRCMVSFPERGPPQARSAWDVILERLGDAACLPAET